VEFFSILFKVLLGFVALVLIRAIIRTKSQGKDFDVLTWIKYDFQRLCLGFLLSLATAIILFVEPNAVNFLAFFGLKITSESAIIAGFAVGGFSLWKRAETFKK
jgi:hypothetical protein